MARNIDLSQTRGVVGHMYLKLFLAGLAMALAVFVPCRAIAQTTGSLTGVVKDTTGGIIPGAKITLVNESDKSVRSTVSSGDAFFSFAAVQTGTYDLTVTFKGFEAYVVAGIEVHPGDNKTIQTISLKPGQVDETVTVSATTAGVTLSSPEKSFIITDEDIKRLSTVGRDVSELIRILPGFAVSSAGLNNDSTNNASQVAGFSGSSIGSFAANGAAPGAGAVAVVSDGVNTTDPADASSSIGNANMEMVAEVKVQTSNFGADSAKGPVVVNAISKSGGANYHGSVYGYARNSALNSNDWIDNYFGNARAGTYNYFPGANIGGPVKIPHSDFNRSKKLTFFTAGEVYDQRNLSGNTATLSFIPTQRMLSGDLSTGAIESALNLLTGASLATCPGPYGCTGLNNSGVGYSPAGSSADVQGHLIVNGQIPQADFDPNVAAYTRFYPAINRIPQPEGNPGDCTDPNAIFDSTTNTSLLGPGQLCSDGINFDANIFAQHNGFQYHARVDENFSDATKLYVTYDYEKVSDQNPITNTGYAGSAQNIIPSPTGELTNAYSHRLSINNTHTFGPTLTNEVVLAGVYYFSPAQLQNNALLQDANTGFVGPRYFNNGDTQLPEIVNFQGGVPDFAMGYFDPSRGAPKRKYSANAADNLTKQLQRHTIKVGVYVEQSANNEFVQGYNNPQGQLSYSQYGNCHVYGIANANTPGTSLLGNSVGNFLNGCASNYAQANRFQSGDMKFSTLDAYATDEWKATKKLTLTYGIRFDHLGPWVDKHGQGLAVWEPEKIQQHVVYNLNPADPTTWPGIAWHNGKGTTLDPSLPLSGTPSRALFYSPRAGLAYDLYGNGHTTFRGGWGAYRYHDSYYTSEGPLLTALGIQIYTNPDTSGCTLAQIGNSGRLNAGQPAVQLGNGPFVNPLGQTCGGGNYNPFRISAADKTDSQQPVTYNYNFTADQQLGKGSLLEISYVGNQTRHSLTGGNGATGSQGDYDTSNQNAIPLGGMFQPDPNTSSPNYGAVIPVGYSDNGNFFPVEDWRPYPNYYGVIVEKHITYSNYNALQLSVNKQSGALTYNLNYTWSKALGIRGTNGNGSVGDSLNIRNNYGLLPYNRKGAANFTFSYQEGVKYHGNRYVGGALNGWEISGITSLQSGPDVAAFNSNFGTNGSYGYSPTGKSNDVITENFDGIIQLGTPSVTVQPVLTCNPKQNLPGIMNGAKTFINGNCFTLPAPGTNGSFNLPDVHGPKYFNSDLTLIKNFHIKQSQGLQFRLAGFNYLNHPNYQLYGGPATGTNIYFGQHLPTVNGALVYPTTEAAARAGLAQLSTNFGSTPYKSSLRILELGFKYTF